MTKILFKILKESYHSKSFKYLILPVQEGLHLKSLVASAWLIRPSFLELSFCYEEDSAMKIWKKRQKTLFKTVF